MPYPTRLNPHLDRVRRHARQWAGAMGLLDALPGWDASTFEATDFGLFTALTHPDAPPDELELVNDWHVWGWFVDDLFAETFERTRDLAGAKAFIARLKAFLPEDPADLPSPTNPAELGLADLWSRTAPAMPSDMRAAFPSQIEEFTSHRLWEIAHIIQNRIPDPVDYIENRRKVTEFSTTLAQHALGGDVPPEIFESAPMRALAAAFADIGPLRNDIFSYEKEAEREGGIFNGVNVVRRFLGCDLPQAVAVVNDLTTQRLREFEHIVADELPPLYDEFQLSAAACEQLRRYVDGLRDWMAGDLNWSRRTGRYNSHPGEGFRPGRLVLRGPVGLGTQAARIASRA
jgi:germacradienol/geosmin synthase